jgi:hypothetical protein
VHFVLFSSPFLPRAPWAPPALGVTRAAPQIVRPGGSPSLRLASLVLGPSCADLRLLYLVRFRELLACVWLLLCCLSVHYRFAFLALLVYVCAWPAASPRPRSWLPGSWYFTIRVHFHASLQFRSLSWRPAVGSTCVFPAPSLTRLVPVPCFIYLFIHLFILFFFSLSCTSFPVPWRPAYGTSFGYLRVLPIGLPLASSTPADSYRWCLLAAHTSFLSVINNC